MGAGLPVIELESVDSTNGYIRTHPELWTRPFCAVVAREQTAGRGRHGRRWHSAPGLDLTFSLLFMPPSPPTELAGVTLLAGLAVYRALLPRLDDGLRLKWPNDLQYKGKKISGILCELFDAGKRPGVIIGIGVNVNSTHFPEELEDAASLRIITGRSHDTGELLTAILGTLAALLKGFNPPIEKALLREWEAASSSIGARVHYRRPDGMASGVIGGIDSRGFLLIRNDCDAKIVPYAGEVLFDEDR